MATHSPPPEISVVIPVYNEARLLQTSVRDFVAGLEGLQVTFEIVLAENGSRDDTIKLAQNLAAQDSRIRTFSYPAPNYGGALREGIYRARGRHVICEEIDLCDIDFVSRALDQLRRDAADMVVGSKAMRGAHDKRPPLRRFATRVYNGMLRVSLGYRGTDTHGLKAFQRDRVLPIVGECVVEHDVFASELVIRSQRKGLRLLEIPVEIEEKRAPSINLINRIPRVCKNLGRLWVSVHLGRGPSPAPAPPTSPSHDELGSP
ncbi:MAG: glycosyltransferase [Myxococcales bacterium FL481]|nr:MAG: glycosyltransferase [Myxococcales bacterium FL481]